MGKIGTLVDHYTLTARSDSAKRLYGQQTIPVTIGQEFPPSLLYNDPKLEPEYFTTFLLFYFNTEFTAIKYGHIERICIFTFPFSLCEYILII